VRRALEVAGFNLSENELFKLGEEILKNKQRFKFREGFQFDKLRLPKRVFTTPSPLGLIDEDELRNTIDAYKALILGN